MIDKNELIAALEGRIMGGHLHNGGYIHVPLEEAEQIYYLLTKQPEIVRCKDCIHWDYDDCEIGNNPQMFAEDWYCPCGEVKQE